MIDIKAIKAAAEAIKHWSPTLTHAWLDTSEDDPAAVAGHIDEEGNTFDVVMVDCDQYSQGEDSLPLAKHIATANPTTVIAMCDEMERLRSTINEFHHAIKDAGWHPGRTDDLLTDVIRAKGVEIVQLQEQNTALDAKLAEVEKELMFHERK